MSYEDFEKEKEKLMNEKNENEKKGRLYENRMHVLKLNSFTEKLTAIFGVSMFAYFIINLLVIALLKSSPSFINMILNTFAITNVFTLPMIIVGSSLTVGVLVKALFSKIYKHKEALKSFSNSKTEREKLQEEVYYKIELEKVNNRNLVIDNTIDYLKFNKFMLETLSNDYEITDKNKANETRKKELEKEIKEEYDKLDILSTQKVLQNIFNSRVRSNFDKRMNSWMQALFGGVLIMMIICLPLIVMSDLIRSVTLFSLFTPFIPLILGSSFIGGYIIKTNKDYQKVFNHFNLNLGKNKLPESYKKYENFNDERLQIQASLESQMKNISLKLVELKEEENRLKSLSLSNDTETKIKPQENYSKEKNMEDSSCFVELDKQVEKQYTLKKILTLSNKENK